MATNSVESSKAPATRSQTPVATPWTKIVRGAVESDLIAATPHPLSAPKLEASIHSIPMRGQEVSSNGNAGKRPSSNVSSDGLPRTVEAGASIEAQSWPALSDSTRSMSRSSSESVKNVVHGVSSISISEGSVTTTQRQADDHRIANMNQNSTVPVRQRSINKRSSATSSGGVVTQLPSQLDQSTEVQTNRVSPRYHNPRSNLNSQTQSNSEHPRPRSNSFRNRNGGTRGEGFHHQNFGNRHDQERGNQEWNPHRNFGAAREAHLQQHIPGSIRAPTPIPYASFSPSQMWSYGNPMGYPELGSPLYYLQAPPSDLRAVTLPLSPHAVYFPYTDPQLLIKISNQIDYYFSEENLIKDTYLRQNMDDQGWVSISLIAGFKKISNLTDNVKLILDAIQTSTIVEVQGEKVRKRNDWMKWIMPSSYQFSSTPTTQVP